MNSPRSQELAKLHAIADQVRAVEERVVERMPHTRQHILAMICALKWKLTTMIKHGKITDQNELDAITKKLRMDVGAFDYRAKEQSELLTRYLCELDNVLSHGNTEVKDARKALVVSIQSLLNRADALKEKVSKLKEFAEQMIEALPVVETTQDAEMEEDTTQTEQPAEVTSAESVTDTADNNEPGDDDMDADSDDDNEDEENIAESVEPEQPEIRDDEPSDEMDMDVSSLPVWRPYYQLQKRPDGVYLVANLQGVDPRYLRVSCSPQTGLLTISGVKFPTHKDLILSRFSGAPTFGRFQITQRFDASLLNLDEARQLLSPDGTLQIHLPYYFVYHPRRLRRMNDFVYHPTRRCAAVW